MKKLLLGLGLALFATAALAQSQTLPNRSVPFSSGPGTVGWRPIGPCTIGQTIGWPSGISGNPECVSATGITVSGTAPITSTLVGANYTVALTTPLAMNFGGTGANLTAANGGIIYSDANSFEVLAATATAGQMLRSGSNAAPTWSTSVWPATSAAGTIAASLTANTFTATAAPILGIPGTTMGTMGFAGSTSGTVTVTPQATAGSPTITWPNASGTVAVGATSPLALSATTGGLTCPTCVTSSGGGAITGTAPVAVSAAGAVSITGAANQVLAGAGPAFTATPTLGTNGGTGGQITLNGATSGAAVIKVAAAAGTTNFQLPVGNGSGGQLLATDGTGVLSWTTASGTGTVTSVTCGGLAITGSGTCPASPGLINHSLAVSAAGGALTIALKDAAGSDPAAGSPVTGNFRNVTTTTGSWTQLSVTAATSLVISSGSTLGVSSSAAFRLWVVLFNDGGTARLGVINPINITGSPLTGISVFPLNPGQVASSTAEGGAGGADGAGIFYTGTAVANKAYLIVGYLEWDNTGLTAGTWTTTDLLYVQSYHEGIPLPGTVLRTLMMSVSSPSAVAVSSYSGTGTVQAITPTSAANLIRIVAFGTGQNSNAAATVMNASLFRDSTQLTPVAAVYGSSGVAASGISFDWYDNPNSTSSIDYQIKIKSTDNSTTVRWPGNAGETAQMVVQEVMR